MIHRGFGKYSILVTWISRKFWRKNQMEKDFGPWSWGFDPEPGWWYIRILGLEISITY